MALPASLDAVEPSHVIPDVITRMPTACGVALLAATIGLAATGRVTTIGYVLLGVAVLVGALCIFGDARRRPNRTALVLDGNQRGFYLDNALQATLPRDAIRRQKRNHTTTIGLVLCPLMAAFFFYMSYAMLAGTPRELEPKLVGVLLLGALGIPVGIFGAWLRITRVAIVVLARKGNETTLHVLDVDRADAQRLFA